MALRQLDVLIAGGSDLGVLTMSQQQALSAWVALGGDLVVYAGAGWASSIDGLPPGPASVGDHGYGAGGFAGSVGSVHG